MSEKSESVREIMSRSPFTLSPKRRTSDALDLMIEADIGSVPVVEKGKLVGIITERDIVREITKSFDYLNRPLGSTARKHVITVKIDTPVWQAFVLMVKNNIRRLPVMKGSKIVGIVTERDLFKWAVKVAYEPNIPKDLKRVLERRNFKSRKRALALVTH